MATAASDRPTAYTSHAVQATEVSPALVAVEAMDRLITRARAAIEDDADSVLASALMGAASALAAERLATDVKDQALSDAIAAEARSYVCAVLAALQLAP